MSTISGLSTSVFSGYALKSGSVSTSPPPASTLTSTFTLSSASAPLTYNAAGLLYPRSSAQAAQNAVIAAQNAMTQTLDSMMSGSQMKSSAADLFGSNTNDPPGQAGTSNPGKMTAQQAYLDAQNVVTQSLNAIV